MNNAWDELHRGDAMIEKLRAELAGKDATIQLLRQLLDAKEQEIRLQKDIICGLSLKLKELTEKK